MSVDSEKELPENGRVLVTGGAGFIGSHLVDRLLEEGWEVVALDNFDPFYDRAIKESNIFLHRVHPCYHLIEGDIRDTEVLASIEGDFDVIVHLAARPGVRPSIVDPIYVQDVNVRGTQNMLEFAREREIPQFVFASSSSVYGVNPRVPWSEEDHVLMPISPYASSKVSGELLGHVYSHLYDIRFVALRFFTVYGPRQRPDLAIHKFARLMLEGQAIPMYGDGSTRRDYTYVDDIISGIRAAMGFDRANYAVINLGNSRTISLKEMINGVAGVLGVQPNIDQVPVQPGDVPQTFADTRRAAAWLGYDPQTPFGEGLHAFNNWLKAAGVQL
jgi:UDP-glucuronate 4-epimerase